VPKREEPTDKTGICQQLEKTYAGQDFVIPDMSRAPVNIVFIGHVDAGKSTICGNILLMTGRIDRRLVEKYEKEALELNRESWWLAYVMD
jgi:peptide chain release factor subunit 3